MHPERMYPSDYTFANASDLPFQPISHRELQSATLALSSLTGYSQFKPLRCSSAPRVHPMVRATLGHSARGDFRPSGSPYLKKPIIV